MMCGIDKAIETIEKHIDEDQMYPQVINRMKYIRDKDNGVRPNRYKHKTFDYYKCGQCGFGINDISFNWCPNCGYGIKWDSIRCLTRSDGEEQ